MIRFGWARIIISKIIIWTRSDVTVRDVSSKLIFNVGQLTMVESQPGENVHTQIYHQNLSVQKIDRLDFFTHIMHLSMSSPATPRAGQIGGYVGICTSGLSNPHPLGG